MPMPNPRACEKHTDKKIPRINALDRLLLQQLTTTLPQFSKN